MLHITSSPLDWYVTRAAGIVAYILLTAVVVAGVTTASRRRPPLPRFAMVDIHRFASLLAGVFVTVHVAAIAIDAFLPFSIGQLVVPFTSTYRPVWVGLGIVATELLIALAVSNRLRHRLGASIWKRLHFLNFVVWIAATVHGMGAGTDARSPWAVMTYAAAVGAVTTACALRVSRAHPLSWARAAPLGLLLAAAGAGGALALSPARSTASPASPATSFDAQLTGKILVRRGPARAIVSMSGRGKGRTNVLVRADLLLSELGAEQTSLQMEYLPSGETCIGEVTAAQGASFDGRCTMPDGSGRSVHGEWSGTSATALHGTLRVRPDLAAAR